MNAPALPIIPLWSFLSSLLIDDYTILCKSCKPSQTGRTSRFCTASQTRVFSLQPQYSHGILRQKDPDRGDDTCPQEKIGVETTGTGIPQLPAVPGIGRYISLYGSDPADIYGRKHHGNLRRLRRGTDVQSRAQIVSCSVVDMHGRNGIHLWLSCYKKLPSDFNSTPHSLRIRVYTGYNWRPWDATPEIAELEADDTLCFHCVILTESGKPAG